MRRLLVVLAIAVGSVIGLQSETSAHVFDGTALWSCAYTRPAWSPNLTIVHASPANIGNGWVQYWCNGKNPGNFAWRALLYTGSGYVRADSDIVNCALEYCWENYNP